MSLAELLSAAQALDGRDKLRLIRVLADDLDRDEVRSLIPSGTEIPMQWPIEAYAVAAQLQQLLAAEKARP